MDEGMELTYYDDEDTSWIGEGSNQGGGITCEICNKSFKSPDSLQKHKAVHQGKTVCPVCRIVFSRVSNMRRHLTNVHQNYYQK